MSFEGEYQCLCANGHQFSIDIYAVEIKYESMEDVECPHCEARVAWWNLVDLTNGSFGINPETGKQERIDGRMELEIDQPMEICNCPTCGNKHVSKQATYKIPEEGHMEFEERT